MKPIVVKNQAVLGPARCFKLAVTGMYYRLARSAITVLILSLAVAFLSYVLQYGIISHDIEYHAYKELKGNRLLGEWISRMTTPEQKGTILLNFLNKEQDRKVEYATWGQLTPAEVSASETAAVRLSRFYSWFSTIPLADRAQLIADKDPQTVAEELVNSAALNRFIATVKEQKLRPPLGSFENLEKCILQELPLFNAIVDRIKTGQLAAISITHPDSDSIALSRYFMMQNAALRQRAESAGFKLSAPVFKRLGELAQIEADGQRLGQLLNIPDVRGQISRSLGLSKSGDLTYDLIVDWLAAYGNAQKCMNILKTKGNDTSLTTVRLANLGNLIKRNKLLEQAAPNEAPTLRTGLFQLPGSARWLILLSFLVCIVGITNTMLMAVTDRFSEIATMKCIGALDGYVMQLFVFEAFFQAILGSAIGVVIGFFLSFIRAAGSYGPLAFESLRISDSLAISFISFVTGILIAAIAATWPSWTAARLAPMEAMRVE